MILKKEDMQVLRDDKVILTGTRNHDNGMWEVQLDCNKKHNNNECVHQNCNNIGVYEHIKSCCKELVQLSKQKYHRLLLNPKLNSLFYDLKS